MRETQKKKTRWTLPVRSFSTFRKRRDFGIPQENIIDLKRLKKTSKQGTYSVQAPSSFSFPGERRTFGEKIQGALARIVPKKKETINKENIHTITKSVQEAKAQSFETLNAQTAKTVRFLPQNNGNKVRLFQIQEQSQVPLRPYADTKEKKTAQRVRNTFHPRELRRTGKHILIFALAALVLISPVFIFKAYGKVQKQQQVFEETMKQGAETFQAGAQVLLAGEAKTAEDMFRASEIHFHNAQEHLSTLTGGVRALKWLPAVGGKLRSAEHLAIAGEEASIAGKKIALALAGLQRLEGIGNILGLSDIKVPLTTVIVMTEQSLKPAVKNVQNALKHVKAVDPQTLPKAYQTKLIEIQKQVPVIEQTTAQIFDLFDGLLTILGHEEARRYLFVFANNDELRASLGFLGGFAVIDISKGRVSKLEIPGGGVYDISSWLDQKLQAPHPLRLVNPHWQIQDANWWPDWPTSAEKIMWFYEHSQGPTVDGVLGITPDVIERLLPITGPIDMTEDYGIVIDATNFRSFAQTSSEITLHETETPKQFIADFAPKFLNAVFSLKKENIQPTLLALYEALRRREMLVYFSEAALEERMKLFGWGGEIKQVDGDFLMLVKTNIAGGKTDGVIDDTLTHTANITEDGTIVNTVTLTRVHNGADDVLKGMKNTAYLRFYVPEGSKLRQAQGFSRIPESRFLTPEDNALEDEDFLTVEGETIIDERTGVRIQKTHGKTVFGQWLELAPGEGRTVTIEYELPWKLDLVKPRNRYETYSFFLQKQAGARPMRAQSSVTLPKQVEIVKTFPLQAVTVEGNVAEWKSDFVADSSYSIILQKEDH